MKTEFAFSIADEAVEAVSFVNEIGAHNDGWAQLAPYGDFHGVGFRKKKDGTIEKIPSIQRVDRIAADQMVAQFHSPTNSIKRFIKGCQIFSGHPNCADAKGQYPDPEPKGLIVDLEARADGIYCKPAFYNSAEKLLNSKQKLFFSGHWSSDELPEENGHRVFRPDALKSAGIVPNPNLRVHHINDKESNTSPINNMNKKQLIEALAALGVEFANDADDTKLIEAVNALGAKAKAATETLATEKIQFANEKLTLTNKVTALDNTIATLTTERDTARVNFANERNANIKGLLDASISSGRITAAERPDWERRLGNPVEFANESAAVSKLPVKIKTTTITDDKGERKVEIANASQRRETVQELVRLEMARASASYDQAFATVKRANPALFEAMKQPKAKAA